MVRRRFKSSGDDDGGCGVGSGGGNGSSGLPGGHGNGILVTMGLQQQRRRRVVTGVAAS